MVSPTLILQALIAANEAIAQIRAIRAMRRAGAISEAAADDQIDKVIAAAKAFDWIPVTPPVT